MNVSLKIGIGLNEYQIENKQKQNGSREECVKSEEDFGTTNENAGRLITKRKIFKGNVKHEKVAGLKIQLKTKKYWNEGFLKTDGRTAARTIRRPSGKLHDSGVENINRDENYLTDEPSTRKFCDLKT